MRYIYLNVQGQRPRAMQESGAPFGREDSYLGGFCPAHRLRLDKAWHRIATQPVSASAWELGSSWHGAEVGRQC
jgi:hypothetical protein